MIRVDWIYCYGFVRFYFPLKHLKVIVETGLRRNKRFHHIGKRLLKLDSCVICLEQDSRFDWLYSSFHSSRFSVQSFDFTYSELVSWMDGIKMSQVSNIESLELLSRERVYYERICYTDKRDSK